jgi:membrane protein DedA with SNARE-associated domain
MDHLIDTYVYVAVFVVVTIGCAVIPLPSVAILVATAAYAGSAHQLNIWIIITVASVAAILGNLIGYWLGSRSGTHVLERYGPRLGLTERRLRLGQYVFNRYAGWAILFGRFVGPMRAWMGILAGLNGMPRALFVRFSIIGGIVWALVWGLGAYLVGDNDHNVSLPGGLITWAILAIAMYIFLRRTLKRLIAEAEADMASPTSDEPSA